MAAHQRVLLVHGGFPPQGCREKTDPFNPNPKDWSAFRSRDYGYTRMQVVNATHLYLEQVSDDQVTPTSSRADLKRVSDPPITMTCLSVLVRKGD